MKPKRSTLRKLSACFALAIVGGATGYAYTVYIGGQPLIGMVVGCAMFGGVSSFELFYVLQPSGAWLRRKPLLVSVALSTLAWVVIIALSVSVIPSLLGSESGRYSGDLRAAAFLQDVVVALTLLIVANVAMRLRSLVGGRVLLNFLIGRYNRPVREQRVFMFLDIADSTRLSEELGDIRVQEYIGRFFFDIAQPIIENGGETHRYIGDEIVVTWPLSSVVGDARCITCAFDIQNLMAREASKYKADFDVVPKFRIGMHGGPVVASEIGDDKREIVYFGDTINSAARLQALCKEAKQDFLVSADLLSMITLPEGITATDVGEVELRGKSRLIGVRALSRSVENGE